MYKLGKHSQQELEGVHPDLVRVIELAIQFSEQDFTVHDGIRSAEDQHGLHLSGASPYKDGYKSISKHQRQPEDNLGHAADLVPYIRGKLRWEWEPIYNIALAMRRASEELGIPIRWGGCWSRLDHDARHPRQMVEDYVARRRAQGKKAFNDGPHYELAT